MIDGRKNNGYNAPSATNSMPPKKKPKGRQSVLAKLQKSRRRLHSAVEKRNISKLRKMIWSGNGNRKGVSGGVPDALFSGVLCLW